MSVEFNKVFAEKEGGTLADAMTHVAYNATSSTPEYKQVISSISDKASYGVFELMYSITHRPPDSVLSALKLDGFRVYRGDKTIIISW